MKNVLTALACLISVSFFGQGWEQTYGGEYSDFGRSVQQTSDGGYIITGSTHYTLYDLSCYLIKTDENGSEQWSQTFGGDLDSVGKSVHQTTDGGYIIVGSNGLGMYSDVYLIKTDNNGTEQWSNTFGGLENDQGVSVQQTTDGGYIITGWTNSFGNGGSDVYLIKTDGNGIEQWSQTFGGESSDVGRYVQQTSDGGYIITGLTESLGNGNQDVYLIKTDGSGNELWNKTFGGTDWDEGHSVQQTSDGGYIIAGGTDSFGNETREVYLIKTDGNGNELWSQTYGGDSTDSGESVQQTSDGGYIITGLTESFGNGQWDVYLIKTDGNGNELWTQTFGGEYMDVGASVQQTSDGGYIITGHIFGGLDFDVYLIKTDSEGTLSSSFTIPTPSPRKLEKVVDALGREVNHTTNQILFHIYDDGSVEKKFIVE